MDFIAIVGPLSGLTAEGAPGVTGVLVFNLMTVTLVTKDITMRTNGVITDLISVGFLFKEGLFKW